MPAPTAGPRLTEPGEVVAAAVCRGGGTAEATPAEARALAAALASPQPAKRRVVCADHVLTDQPRWVLRLVDGTVVSPAAPVDSCGRPIAAVQAAITAILAGGGAVGLSSPR